jgi:hypothetical protein
VLVLEELLVVDEGEVVGLLVEDDEGTAPLLVVVVPVVVFEDGTELTKDGILVATLPVGVMVLPL